MEFYGYAPDNKRGYRVKPDGSQEFTLYGVRGEVYTNVAFVKRAVNFLVYFGGKLVCEGACTTVWGNGQAVFQDRLGTNRTSGARFRPYGDAITSTTNDREKFGTYNRDGFSGLDYADQRMYASSLGRFDTADSAPNSRIADPISWNKYSYTVGDPVGPAGQDWCDADALFASSAAGGYACGWNPCLWVNQGEYWDPWTAAAEAQACQDALEEVRDIMKDTVGCR